MNVEKTRVNFGKAFTNSLCEIAHIFHFNVNEISKLVLKKDGFKRNLLIFIKKISAHPREELPQGYSVHFLWRL